jgi:hypothetical protein
MSMAKRIYPEEVTARELTFVARNGSLADKRPDLVSEWHPTKNGSLKPTAIPPNSLRQIWWICPNGHEYQTHAANRLNSKHGCKICALASRAQQRSLYAASTVGSVATLYPEFVAQWHKEKNTIGPEQVSPGSHYVAHWVCSRGHEWMAQVKSRVKRGDGCPHCNNYSTSRLEIALYCEIAAIFPDTDWRKEVDGIEVDIFVPSKNLGLEVDGAYWHSDKHEKDKQKTAKLSRKGIALIRLRDEKLGRLDHRDILLKKNISHIQAACLALMEVANHLPTADPAFQTINQYIANAKLVGTTKYKKILAQLPGPEEHKSFAAEYPEIAERWDHQKNYPLKPNMFSSNSSIKVGWRCSKGHEWMATLASLTRGSTHGNGCKKCWYEGLSMFRSQSGSLTEARPDLLTEWDDERNVQYDPTKLAVGSSTKVWWKCAKGHHWYGTIRQRASAKYGCMECSREHRRTAKSETRNLEFQFPDTAAMWDYEKNGEITPKNVFPKSRLKFWWKCDKGHSWQASVGNMTKAAIACPKCVIEVTQKKADATRLQRSGSLADKYPMLAKLLNHEKNGSLKPDSITSGSVIKVSWVCSLGHDFQARITDVVRSYRESGREGCSICRFTNKKKRGSKSRDT